MSIRLYILDIAIRGLGIVHSWTLEVIDALCRIRVILSRKESSSVDAEEDEGVAPINTGGIYPS